MADKQENRKNLFQARSQFRILSQWGSILHVFALCVLLVFGLVQFPKESLINQKLGVQSASVETKQLRQRLLELLDRMVRYQSYYRQINGQFTRDLQRLGLPRRYFEENWADVHRAYEIAVVDVGPSKLLIMASGIANIDPDTQTRHDRIVIDERLRVNANFPLPHLSRQYLLEEVKRRLNLQKKNRSAFSSLADEYWNYGKFAQAGEVKRFALGRRAPVRGERVVLPKGGREVASIFSETSNRIRSIQWGEAEAPAPRRIASKTEIHAILGRARLAQHIHLQESGTYARRWKELDSVAGFRFRRTTQEISNLRLEPIEADDNSFMVSLKGTSGSLLGEVFSINEAGTVKQIRFSDTIINRLQKSQEWLEKNLYIREVGETN